MQPQPSDSSKPQPPHQRQTKLSYKFQRLREQIRQAILSGELHGKLPGERVLAQRFKANAKTLSKALTDLAAEGLLDRSIGRGTYVSGSAPETQTIGPWLLLHDAQDTTNPLINELRRLNPESRCLSDASNLRPSFLSQFSAVISCMMNVPESFYRDLLVRGIPLIDTGWQPRVYSTHAVMIDRSLSAFCLGRDLLLAGHKHLAAIDVPSSTVIADALRLTATRYSPDAIIESCTLTDIPKLLSQGLTAIVCDGASAAAQVRLLLDQSKVDLPEQISLAAVGSAVPDAPCSGYYVEPARHAQTIVGLLTDLQPHRPSVLWLAGTFIDRATIATPTIHRATPLIEKHPSLLAS